MDKIRDLLNSEDHSSSFTKEEDIAPENINTDNADIVILVGKETINSVAGKA